jgi:peptide methionine sulfoxide reductase msrA/msrB
MGTIAMQKKNSENKFFKRTLTAVQPALVIAASLFLIAFTTAGSCYYKDDTMYKELTPEEEHVIINKGTERAFTGKYNDHYEKGIYTCRKCGAKLYESSSKFKSDCGWPSFDDEIPNAVKRQPDADGQRIEIICANCDAHLGHVFSDEGYTSKNIRHCVNSISMEFTSTPEKTNKAIFASGCFWGVEYQLKKLAGIVSTTAGYTGGKTEKPTYEQVCTGNTGHAEAVQIVYDPNKVTYEQLAKLYFETHDFTQLNRQGPDVGTQYRTEIFYLDDRQKKIAQKLIAVLEKKKYDVKTKLTPASKFWPAEEHHQDYYQKTKKTPYCHIYKKIF